MEPNTESLNANVEEAEKGLSQTEQSLADFFKSLTPADFHKVERSHDLNQQGLLPTLELSADQKRKAPYDHDSRYEDRSAHADLPKRKR